MKDLFGSCEIVSDIYESEKMAREIYFGKRCNIVFDTSFLKNRFFALLKEYDSNINIINCDARPERFEKDINDSYGLVVFDHINKCHDINILNEIEDKILIY